MTASSKGHWTVVVWTLYFLGQQLIRRPRHYHDHRPHITMNMITEFVKPCNPLHFSKHHQRRMNHVVHRFYTVIPAHLRFYCQKKQHPPERFYPNKSSLEIRACVCWRRRHLPECWNVCLPLPGLWLVIVLGSESIPLKGHWHDSLLAPAAAATESGLY